MSREASVVNACPIMISACSQVAATADRSKAPDFYCPLLLAPCHMMPLHPQPEATTNDEFFKNAFPNAEVKDEKSLKEHVRKQIELGYERDEKMYFHTKVALRLLLHFGLH